MHVHVIEDVRHPQNELGQHIFIHTELSPISAPHKIIQPCLTGIMPPTNGKTVSGTLYHALLGYLSPVNELETSFEEEQTPWLKKNSTK